MMQWLSGNRWWMVHSTRIVTAGVTTLAIVHALGLSVELSAVISAIAVTQSNLGGSLKVAFEQVIGSVLGAALATIVAIVIVPDDPFSTALALAISILPLSVMAAHSRGFQVAPITAAIVVLGAPGLEIGPHVLATDRLLGVALGCSVGLVTSMLVLPARASRSMVETAARIVKLMAEQLRGIAPGDGTGEDDLGPRARDIRKNLILLGVFVEEAERERRAAFGRTPDGERLLRILRRVRHDIDMLRRAARGGGDDALHRSAEASWKAAAVTAADTLLGIHRLLTGQTPSGNDDALAESVRAYRATLDEMRQEGLTRAISTPALNRLFGVGFGLDQLRRDLDDLAEASQEIVSLRKPWPA